VKSAVTLSYSLIYLQAFRESYKYSKAVTYRSNEQNCNREYVDYIVLLFNTDNLKICVLALIVLCNVSLKLQSLQNFNLIVISS